MKLLLSAILALLCFQISAQEMYHRVRIDIHNKDIHTLAELGLELDHGHLAPDKFIENDFSEKQLADIKSAGFHTEILQENMGEYYRKQLGAGLQRIQEGCFGEELGITTPANFTLGSMGGFYTYEEFLAIVDDMQVKFPNLISSKAEIGDIKTHEDRPLYSIIMSDNPSMDEVEPQVLYTAIHHAREPNGLTQLIFFMWHMLESYETDDRIKNLLDNTQLHFIPMVNPDGYVYNQTTNPDGGGFWRKNRRDNEDGTVGVDLNRNYGFEWGADNSGSSPNPNSDTYRGPAPFSEPETQAVKLYTEANNFTFALNYHTFGNLLIYPWGYNDTPTAENAYYSAVATELTKSNSYTYGTGTETVGYVVNGDTDDWMYGETTTKNKVYSMTPEVGTQGFWPPIDAIIGNCQDNLQANISQVAMLLNYPIFTTNDPVFVDALNGTINYSTTQLGFQTEPYFVIAEGVSDNVTVSGNTEYDLEQLEEGNGMISFTIDTDISFGEEVVIAINTSENLLFGADTIRFNYLNGASTEEIVLEEFGEDVFWEAGGEEWFYTDERFTSPAVSMTESVNSNYSAGLDKSLLSKSIELPDNQGVMLTFDLWVDIEDNYDFAMLYIIPDGESAIPLCGNFSDPGSGDQATGLPVYDGIFGWVKEEIDLSMWAGKIVQFQWRMRSDNFVEGDGFYVDDWKIGVVSEVTNIDTEIGNLRIYPNPVTDELHIEMAYEDIERVWVINAVGQRINTTFNSNNILSMRDNQAGIYFILLRDTAGKLYSQRVIKN